VRITVCLFTRCTVPDAHRAALIGLLCLLLLNAHLCAACVVCIMGPS